MRARAPDQPGEVAVRHELPDFQTGNKTPHVLLECRSFEVQGQIEAAQPPLKIRANLARRFAQQRIAGRRAARLRVRKRGAANACSVALYGQNEPERCLYRRLRQIHARLIRAPGTMPGMEKKPAHQQQEPAEVHKEAVDADEGDKALDQYDKEVADSFPASDPPAQP